MVRNWSPKNSERTSDESSILFTPIGARRIEDNPPDFYGLPKISGYREFKSHRARCPYSLMDRILGFELRYACSIRAKGVALVAKW
jgi:hypothetical protein